MPLLSTNKIPPGGWRYLQLDAAGKEFKFFHSMGTHTAFCREILECRIGNNFPGADMPTVVKDVGNATCSRLGNDPRYCSGDGPILTQTRSARPVAPLRGCGSCGGRKA